jgi:SAM-dependent methyltransferase
MCGEFQPRAASDDDEGAREAVLRRWIHQPPAGPNVQYLRDAEWTAALGQLGDRSDVLDVASESRVTAAIEVDRLTRLDFSDGASEHARELLEEDVDRFETTSPATPFVPFPDDAFDAAICVGPYDWKFLDVDRLTAELHRVLEPDGRLVLSVPTPNSPYAANGKGRNYSPAELFGLFSPDWRLVESTLLFQYPRRLHTAINRLPPTVQNYFVGVARRLSDRLTEHDRWNDASYVVVGTEPIPYESYLDAGLESLFRSTAADGFWDPEDGKIVRALRYELVDGQPVWTPDDSIEWRYAPLALLGAMQWRSSSLGEDRYDGRLTRELAYFTERVTDDSTLREMPSYGVGPLIAAFSIAADVYDDTGYLGTARRLYDHSVDQFRFDHAEDSLLLYGSSLLYEVAPDEELLATIDDVLWRVNERQTTEGLFEFDNATTRRHQNQMYTLWGLCRAVEATGATGYLDAAERVLDYTIGNRMRDDGGFVWEDVSRWPRIAGAAEKRLTGRPPYWEYLYECHQTFFVNAVAHYYRAGGTKNYDTAVRKAMAWIYGDNALGVDLVEVAGNGVPMRHLTTDGRLDEPYFVDGVRDQRYKGTYEIGSYVMALTHLLDGPLSRDHRREAGKRGYNYSTQDTPRGNDRV